MQIKSIMRYYFLVFCCSLSFAAASQEVGDSKVIITNNLTAEENFMAAGNSLLSAGYVIDKKDDTFYLISSKPLLYEHKLKATTSYILYSIVSIQCFDNKVLITGQHKSPGQAKRPTVVTKKGKPVVAFSKLVDIGNGIEGEISFQK